MGRCLLPNQEIPTKSWLHSRRPTGGGEEEEKEETGRCEQGKRSSEECRRSEGRAEIKTRRKEGVS